jgi:hypothetical protein
VSDRFFAGPHLRVPTTTPMLIRRCGSIAIGSGSAGEDSEDRGSNATSHLPEPEVGRSLKRSPSPVN